MLASGQGRGGLGTAVVAEASGQNFAIAKKFDVSARIIPDFLSAPAFVF